MSKRKLTTLASPEAPLKKETAIEPSYRMLVPTPMAPLSTIPAGDFFEHDESYFRALHNGHVKLISVCEDGETQLYAVGDKAAVEEYHQIVSGLTMCAETDCSDNPDPTTEDAYPYVLVDAVHVVARVNGVIYLSA